MEYDFNKALIDFNGDPIFSKLSSIDEPVKFAFAACKDGDKVYYDGFHFNLNGDGDEIATCVAANGEISSHPLFMWNDSYYSNYYDGLSKCKKLSKLYDVKFYMPSIKELKLMIDKHYVTISNTIDPNVISKTLCDDTLYPVLGINLYTKELEKLPMFPQAFSCVFLIQLWDAAVFELTSIKNRNTAINELYDFNSALISFDDNIGFSKSTLDVINKKQDEIGSLIILSLIDVNLVISKFTMLDTIPYFDSIEISEGEDFDIRNSLYIIIDNNKPYNEQNTFNNSNNFIEFDTFLLQKGFIGFSYNAIPENDDNIIKAIDSVKKFYDDTVSTLFYLSPDYGIIGILLPKSYLKFLPTGLVNYKDCYKSKLKDDNKIGEKFKLKVASLIKGKDAKECFKNIKVLMNDDMPYIDFYMTGKAKTPNYIKTIISGLAESSKVKEVPSFMDMHATSIPIPTFNGEQYIRIYVDLNNKFLITFSTIMESKHENTYRYILRAMPINNI